MKSANASSGINRVFVVVLDSAGVGFLPDADQYGDQGANTLGHFGDGVGLSVAVMGSLGLRRVFPIRGVARMGAPKAAWG